LPQLILTLLGPPRVRYGDVDVTLERNKGLALLAYLAVTSGSHRRDELAVLFWPELDPRHARGGLRHVLWSLTAKLPGPWWQVEREAIGLLSGPDLALDVTHFGHLLSVVRAHRHSAIPACADCCATLAEAVALYQGDFLTGFSLRGCAAFDEWQLSETESLRRALAAALEQLSHAHAVQARFETATAYALRWLALDPLHEPAHQQLMRLYAWSGQRSAALRQYDACVRLLEAELGVSPHEQTAQLFRTIRADTLAAPDRLVPQLATGGFGPPAAASPVSAMPLDARPAANAPGLTAVLDRIVQGHYIGRELEWAQARSAWQRAAAGVGQVLLVSGEPGIGKTRLVHELALTAQGAGAYMLIGECATRGELPYAPFAHIAREILDRPEAGRALSDSVRAGLLSLAPQRGTRQRHPAPPAQPNTILERQRLFDSFANACQQLAEVAPVLMVIEDVHWADAGTLALLRDLARQIGRSRMLLLITYRDTEVELSETRGLPDLLLELNRERRAQVIRLGRLSRQQSGRMLAALLATGEVSDAFRDGLFDETEGNPFFLEEVCKALIQAGTLYFSGGTWHREDLRTVVLPATVRTAILARVERLPAVTQEALRLAAILGREFDFDLLKVAGHQDEAVLQTSLDQATRAQLISADPGGARAGSARFRFAHALIPFALREALGGLRLQRLHRQAAQALEHVRPDDVEGLAAHYTGAGDQPKALAYTVQAATRAQSLYDDETALHHLRAALRLTEAGEMRLAIMEQVGDVLLQRDSNADAARAYQEALEIGSSLPAIDRLTRVRLLRKLAESVWITEFILPLRPFEPAAVAALEEGLGLMAGEPPHTETVRLLVARAHSAWRGRPQQDWAAAERDSRQAVALAEQLNAPLDLSAALESLATVFAARDLFRQRAEASLRRVALTDAPWFAATRERGRALKEAGAALIDVGEYDQALRYLEESEKLASRMHAAEDLVYGLMEQARCLFYLDRWDEVLMDDKLRALREQPTPELLEPTCFHQALMASVHALRGEHEAAAVLRDESVASMVRSDPPEAWGRGHHY
jgi:DNA-binding SARP family transcriptional activator